MTIGFLINTCEPFYRGGYERRAWTFARELARQGHDIRIYTSCPRDEIREGVRFIRLGAFRPFFNRRGVRNGSADLLFALNALRLLGRLRERELDVLDVCATPFIHLPLAALVARIKKIPLVLTCHEALLAGLPAYVRERGHRGGMRAGMVLGLLKRIYRFGMSLGPRRIAVSHRTAAALDREGYPAQAVIEFGLEPDAIGAEPRPRDTSAGSPVRLVYCGRLTPIKSVDQTVAALLSLHAENQTFFHFDILGEGSERVRLERLVRESNAESCFTFHGEVSEAEKRRLLAAGEVFILSSPREGFSIATLEAMAQGCAALVVNDPRQPNGALDFVQHGEQGLCVPPGSEALREGLRLLLHDPKLRLHLRHAARARATNFKIDAQTCALLDFYAASTRVVAQ